MQDDAISRQAAIDAINSHFGFNIEEEYGSAVQEVINGLPAVQPLVIHCTDCEDWLERQSILGFTISELPFAQSERLTDDDFETIRIHLNAYKEKLCNQKRWREAEEYQRIIDRFMAFASAQPETHDKRTETHACDCISRQQAIDAICAVCGNDCDKSEFVYNAPQDEQVILCPEHYCLCTLPSAQSDRDIPIKPAEATETYWGKRGRVAVCPKCDYHLGRVYFLSDGHDIGVRKISYCETCGQAIDWSEWEDEE